MADRLIKRFMGWAALAALAPMVLSVVVSHTAWAEDLAAVKEAKKNPPHINFMLHCQGCHLPGGVGHPGIVPKLAGNVGKFLSVKGGREYLVQVPGSAQSALDNAQLAEVLNWLVAEFDPKHTPKDFQRYSAEEVQGYRSARIRNVTQIRTELLGAYSSE